MDKPEVPQDKIINKINSSINNESYDNPLTGKWILLETNITTQIITRDSYNKRLRENRSVQTWSLGSLPFFIVFLSVILHHWVSPSLLLGNRKRVMTGGPSERIERLLRERNDWKPVRNETVVP